MIIQLPLATDPLLTPAQAALYVPMRARYATDPRRVATCDGCEAFGLCVLHAVGEQNIRRHNGARRKTT